MKELGYGLASLLLLAVIYFGSYCLMVTPHSTTFDADGFAKPEYRVDGAAVETIFFPAFTLDRQFRPERWAATHPFEVLPLLKRVGPKP